MFAEKKWIIVSGIIAVVVVINISLFIISRRSLPADVRQATRSDDAAVSPPAPAETTVWDDSAGFQLRYPKGLRVNKHEEDTANYAHLEFTDTGHAGNIIVWVKDPPEGPSGIPVETSSDWVKSDKRFTGASVLDTSLGGKPAKKILIQSPGKMMIVGAIQDGLVFSVEADLADAGYWSSIFDGIIDSFAYTAPPATETVTPQTVLEAPRNMPAADSQNGTEETLDEEEVIE